MVPRVIPAIGQCIYCLRRGIPLGREHVVPSGLGGTLILLKASCRDCEKAIRAFEEPCIRQTFESPRTYLRVKSKAKHKPRKRRLLVGVGAVPNTTWSVADFDDYPFAFGLPKLDPPPLLSGIIKANDKITITHLGFWFSPTFQAKMAEFGTDTTVHNAFCIEELFRLIAKIGHGFAVAELGLGGFAPLATNMIRGRPDELSNSLVGQSHEQLSSTSVLHDLAVRTTDEYVTVLVRLFAPLSTPTFQVVVGRRFH